MAIRNLDSIFRPRKIAVIGASDKPSSVGATIFRNLIDAEFDGAVLPVNPKHEKLFDRKAYDSVEELPGLVDLAVICTPAQTVPEIVQQCGQAGIMGIVIISAGFGEGGEAGEKLEAKVKKIREGFEGMRMIGPNCLGIIAPHLKLNASFADSTPEKGGIAFISQSGALCTSVLDWALKEEIGFSYFVSIGNMLDVSIGDLIDYFAEDENTQAIIIYAESIQGARTFMSAARAFTREKPIVAYKAGRFKQAAQAAASHTGAMALYETPQEVPLQFASDRTELRKLRNKILENNGDTLNEAQAKDLLESYGIAITKPHLAHSAEEAVDLAGKVGYPVVLKVDSLDISHKTDAGGVELNLNDDDEVKVAYRRIIDSAKEYNSKAKIEGVTVQRMISTSPGFEMILGVKRDPVFGSVLMVGSGGVEAELFEDRALELPPLTERLARRMLESLRCWPLLSGYRNRPAMDIDKLIEVLVRASCLVADHPEIEELDVNPLLATPDDVIALDARITLNRDVSGQPPESYSHLAIRPYPEELTRETELADGRKALLRPLEAGG